jgi:hypothetical protein
VLQGPDILAVANEEVDLMARLEKQLDSGHREPVVGKKVHFWLGERRLGQARTGDSGLATVRFRAEEPGDHLVRLSLSRLGTGSVRSSAIFLRVIERPTPVILVDIEKTLHDHSSLRFPFIPNEKVVPLPDAAEVLKWLSDFRSIVYLSSGDGSAGWKVREWLDGHGFPGGPVFHWATAPEPETGARQKAEKLRLLASKFPNIVAGIGNRRADAAALQANSLDSFIVTQEREGFPAGTHVYASWKDLRKSMSSRWQARPLPGAAPGPK